MERRFFEKKCLRLFTLIAAVALLFILTGLNIYDGNEGTASEISQDQDSQGAGQVSDGESSGEGSGEEALADDETIDEPPLQFVSVKKKIKAGKTFKFKANKEGVTWSVSNGKASIGKKGKFTAKKYGKVKVTATLGDEKISIKVKILPKKVIGIDPGHQSRANISTEPIGPGSSTKKTCVSGGTRGTATGKYEYQLTLEVGKKLKKELISRGYKVVMTRTKNDVNITNRERALKLNKDCDVAVRLHADGGASGAKGASVLYPSSSNAYIGKLSKKCKKLSSSLISAYCDATNISNRGLFVRNDLTGTNWSTIPVALIEMGFMTNSSDDRYMASSKGQKKMAEGLADGLDAYFGC